MTEKRVLRAGAVFWLALVLLGSGSSRVQAQTLTTGSLEGVVTDSLRAPISGAILTLRDRQLATSTTMDIARNGAFNLSFLAPGEYDLRIEAFGYRPLLIERIPIRNGRSVHILAGLAVSVDPNTPVEIRRFGGSAGAIAESFSTTELLRFPEPSRQLSSVARFSTITNPALETEGLPGSFGGLRVDGLPVSSAAAPRRAGGVPVLPLSAFRLAELANVSADVEWNGIAAPPLTAQFARAGGKFAINTFGDFGTGAARSNELSAPSVTGFQAGAMLSGPLLRDTAGFVLGFETWRMETPIGFPARLDSVTARAAEIARTTFGQANAPYPPAHLARMDAAAGFGRLDWRRGMNVLNLRGAFTVLPQASSSPLGWDRAGSRQELKGSDAFFAATLTSRFGDFAGQELQLGWDRGARDYGTGLDGIDAVSTLFVEDGLGFGRDPALAGRFVTQTVRARETVHIWSGEHHIKVGLSADLASHDLTYGASRTASFFFSSTADFARGEGYAVRSTGASAVNFKLPRYGGFAQDEWTIGNRLRVLLGARWDIERPPVDSINLNAEWNRLSGILADSALKRRGRISPRLEFEWQPDAAGSWSLRGAGGVWDAPSDAVLLGEFLANDADIEVSRGFGTFAGWPGVGVVDGAASLTLVAPGFQGPRSTRATLQLSKVLSPGVQFDFGGTYRRTELLPRRTDLNLVPAAGGHDQHGREVFGTLQKRGSVLAAGASNRRFSDFDEVSALGVDGWSEYRAVHASVQAQFTSALVLHARYTYSQTEDNWFMAREEGGVGAMSPFARDSAVDWTEGTSDFDLPHRATVGAELSVPRLRGLNLTGLYRYSSGYAFTPGFRDGVDANGDGSWRNDPAFIDGGSAGFDAVAGRWSCLNQQAGKFAQRNSCRSKAAQVLDLRLAIGLFGTDSRRAELVLDGLNLIAQGSEFIDRALYLIDPARPLSLNAGTRVTTVPLVLNPQFGEPVLNTAPGRIFRIGLRLKY